MSDPRQEWATPADFYAVIDAEFHPTIDVAASIDNYKCDVFLDEELDALGTHEWLKKGKHTVAWCNPGFANMLPWLLKAREQADKHQGIVLVLGLCAPSTEWWRNGALLADEIRLIGGKRIQFDPADGVKRSSNARENALFVFRGRTVGVVPVVYRGPRITTWYWHGLSQQQS